ncbi:MAG: PPC domain-containing protein, partial [Planctomycetia bacterium]
MTVESSNSLVVRRMAGRTGGPAAAAFFAVFGAVFFAPAGTARGQLSVDRVEPGGGSRGTEVEIALSGRELTDPQQLWFENGGIEVVSLTGVDDKRAKATIRIPADCPLGPHRMRLRTKQGLSDLRTFRVGQWPQTQEQEPNNDPATAPEAASPPPVGTARTIGGVVKGEDVDCFPVQARKGERIAVAIDAIRLDQEMFDPFLEIVDGRGFVLASCDDHPLLGQDAMLAVVAPEDGTYTIRVRESAYGGNEGCVYLLHVGRFPVPHVAWPPGGQPGQELEVEWLGDPAGPFRSKVTVPAGVDHDGLAEVRPVVDGIPAATGVPLKVSPHAPAVVQDPNDEPKQAVTIVAPAAVIGRMDVADDVDWVRVEAPKGSAWQVKAWGRRLGSPIDLVVAVHRDTAKRERITSNDDAAGPDSVVRVTTPDEGSFLLRVNDHLRRGGAEFIYWIELEPVAAGVALSVPPGRTNTQDRLVAAVPRGNRMALVFNASRSDVDAALEVGFEGLPSGVRATSPQAVAKAAGTFAVFEAAADAPEISALAGVTATTVATAEAGARPVGGLRQTTELVFGQPNNATYRTSVSDRLPVAVIGESPIRVDVDPPVTPLVRRGSMELRVRIVRAEGFTGKVRLGFPFKPPGIGAPSIVEIGEKETEAVYQLNA